MTRLNVSFMLLNYSQREEHFFSQVGNADMLSAIQEFVQRFGIQPSERLGHWVPN